MATITGSIIAQKLCYCVYLLALLCLCSSSDVLPYKLEQSAKVRNFCKAACRFRFCKAGDGFSLIVPGVSQGSAICRQGQNIEAILATGEVQVLQGRKRIPISKWRPEGLSAPFDRDFFRTKKLPQKRVMSTIVHKQMRGNQSDIVNEQCFLMPIKKYQREIGRDESSKVINVKGGGEKDCIEFYATTSDVYIVLVWYSGDDLDLSVTEPDGTVVSQRTVESRSSTCGKHRRDNGVGACEFFDFSREVVQYSFDCPEFQNGVYKARLLHAENCELRKGPTRWELFVVVKGRIQKSFKGKSNKNKGALIKQVSFKLKRQ